MNMLQDGEVDEFLYHNVYELGDKIYDPRYSPNPVSTIEYFEEVFKNNPAGVNIEEIIP